MIMTSSAFNEALEGGNRNYQVLASVELLSGETLTLDNTLIWSSGLSLDDSIATTSETLEIGTAIVNKATLIINNMSEQFSAYDFFGAVVTLQVGLKPSASDPVAYISKGTFTVESASYNTTLITLTCIDNMHKFDAVYNSSLTFPSTALAVVQDACTACGVTLGVQTFTGASTAVIAPPEQAVTYRNMLSWIGQMIGCCWRINNAGELMPVWYGLSVLEQFYDGGTFAYNSGAELDGGTFAYTDGDNVDGGAFSWTGYFTIIHAASADVAVDDTLVTGVKIQVANTEEDAAEAYTEYMAGTDGYSLVIADNPLITADNAQTIANTLAGRLVGMKYRKGNVVHVSDPRMEAGDVMVYADHKGHAYPMLVSQVLFTVGEYQTSVSASEPPLRNVGQRYSHSMQTGVSTFQAIARERNAREGAISDLEDELASAPGLYQTTEPDGQGGTIYYLHDKPTRAASNIIWKMSSSAVGVSTNGGQSWNAGLTADGNAIVQRLYANAVIAGILRSSDYQYTSGTYTDAGMIVDLDNKTIRAMYAAILGDGKLYASAGAIGAWNIGSTGIYNGLTSLSGVMNGTYIGTDGIAGATSNGLVRYELTPDGHLVLKDYKENGSINVGIRLDAKVGGAFGEYILAINPNNITGIYVDSNNVNHNPLIADFARGIITFDTGTDVGVLKNVYNNTTYNLIRNHNNGNISISASSGVLHLGYENTTGINFFNGAYIFGTNYTEITNANNPVWLRVRNSASGNGIFIQSNIDGTVELASYSASGTRYGILKRANNSNAITTYGTWTFTSSVVSSNSSGQAIVYASNSSTGNRIFIFADASNGQAGLYSYSADNTSRPILVRDNNSNAITAYGAWTFNTGIKGNNNYTGIPVLTESSGASRISYMASATGYVLRVNALWGGSTFATASATFTSSDIRLKENVKNSTVKAMPLVDAINIREFDWKDGRHQNIGFIADELEKLDKNLAVGGGKNEDGTMNIKSVDTFYLLGYAIKAIQELSAEVKKLKGVA